VFVFDFGKLRENQTFSLSRVWGIHQRLETKFEFLDLVLNKNKMKKTKSFGSLRNWESEISGEGISGIQSQESQELSANLQVLSYLDRSTGPFFSRVPMCSPSLSAKTPLFNTNPLFLSWFPLSMSQKPLRRGRTRHNPDNIPSHFSSTLWRVFHHVSLHDTQHHMIFDIHFRVDI
jgi:hypothetical protein